MPEGVRLVLVFASAAALAGATVPAAIAMARRIGLLDSPVGYKAHLQATPYLGGAAVLAAALPAVLLLGHEVGRFWPLLVGTFGLAVVGTVDDRVNLSPWLRVAVEMGAAWFLWSQDLGWSILASDAGNLLLTALWVTAVVNAFNLMDNLDGAAASVAGVSAACVAILAVIGDAFALAAIAAGTCGALIGFLRFNLARPARIFLGDGGSMALGFLLAGCLMVAPFGELSGWSAVIAATLAVGLPLFDTALVIVSRRRRGAPVFSGATDHTTHRLLIRLKSPRVVAGALVLVQSMLCGLAIEATLLGPGAAFAAACVAFLSGAVTIVAAEGPPWMPVSEDS